MKRISYPFNLDATLCCGQVFRWEKIDEWWYGVVGHEVLKMRQVNSELDFENVDEKFVVNYFRLDDDLQRIRGRIGKDEHIEKAIQEFWGLRIVRQDPWECLASYICATFKSIAAIKNMIFRLSKKFGECNKLDGVKFYTFPTPERIARETKSNLRECGLGYRAKYLIETSRKLIEYNLDFEDLRNRSYEEAKKLLSNFPGVGLKVADCVLLFSLDKLEAFPVDVWMKRVVVRHYAEYFSQEFIDKISTNRSLTNKEYERLGEFGRNYFGEYAGYAQEYLYHYERMQ